uniref:Fusion glycoprotein F0 n=1 Tax=La Piedad-Michoacan-Mexico virus TaxID=3052562 RepID=A0A1P8D8A7_LPMV|nr:fusion protein [Orthorubulavirus suis]
MPQQQVAHTCVMLWGIISTVSGINTEALSQYGVVVTNVRQLTYYTQAGSTYLAVRLLPSLASPDQSCALHSIINYNATLQAILSPIAENLNLISTALREQHRKKRFAGVPIGLTALGVATAAQATAAVALVRANKNAEKVEQLSQALGETNAAISDLIDATKNLGFAVQAIQNQINTAILPQIHNLSCQVIDAQLGNILSLYLTELTTVFQPQLTNPALSPLTIQALRAVLGTTLPAQLSEKLKSNIPLGDLMSSGLLKGQLVGLNLQNMLMIIELYIPTLSTHSTAKVLDLVTISSHVNGREVEIQVPNRVLELGSEVLGYGGSECALTMSHILCPFNDARVLSTDMKYCLQGNITHCIFSPVVGSFLRRFALVNGVVIANCADMSCVCFDPQEIIYQNFQEPTTVIDIKKCGKVQLDTLTFTISTFANRTYGPPAYVPPDNIIQSEPLDISGNLIAVNNSLSSALNHLATSEILRNEQIWTSSLGISTIVALVIIGILIICLVVTWAALWALLKEVRGLNSAVNSQLSSYVMGDKFIRY